MSSPASSRDGASRHARSRSRSRSADRSRRWHSPQHSWSPSSTPSRTRRSRSRTPPPPPPRSPPAGSNTKDKPPGPFGRTGKSVVDARPPPPSEPSSQSDAIDSLFPEWAQASSSLHAGVLARREQQQALLQKQAEATRKPSEALMPIQWELKQWVNIKGLRKEKALLSGDGWRLENGEKIPVHLWAHRMDDTPKPTDPRLTAVEYQAWAQKYSRMDYCHRNPASLWTKTLDAKSSRSKHLKSSATTSKRPAPKHS
eukprot:TRINITY_DN4713_c0_g1_i2.p3 TRINITY_DN4713_c0_g1~~TRINITY_DN4713_c0_g1_i2.p3  ORF type:complete len:256 (-),score=14.43 TRINITY_DN4713_c0_g1_i2:30-797(-)